MYLFEPFSARHFVYCIVGRHGKSAANDKIPVRPVPMPRTRARVLIIEVVRMPGLGAGTKIKLPCYRKLMLALIKVFEN